eukprot:3018606-Amphidinium_carterae.1
MRADKRRQKDKKQQLPNDRSVIRDGKCRGKQQPPAQRPQAPIPPTDLQAGGSTDLQQPRPTRIPPIPKGRDQQAGRDQQVEQPCALCSVHHLA